MATEVQENFALPVGRESGPLTAIHNATTEFDPEKFYTVWNFKYHSYLPWEL